MQLKLREIEASEEEQGHQKAKLKAKVAVLFAELRDSLLLFSDIGRGETKAFLIG